MVIGFNPSYNTPYINSIIFYFHLICSYFQQTKSVESMIVSLPSFAYICHVQFSIIASGSEIAFLVVWSKLIHLISSNSIHSPYAMPIFEPLSLHRIWRVGNAFKLHCISSRLGMQWFNPHILPDWTWNQLFYVEVKNFLKCLFFLSIT